MPNFDTSYIRKNVFILPSLFILFSLVEVSKLSCSIFRGLIMASLISTTENIPGAYLFHYNISQFYNFHHFFFTTLISLLIFFCFLFVDACISVQPADCYIISLVWFS